MWDIRRGLKVWQKSGRKSAALNAPAPAVSVRGAKFDF